MKFQQKENYECYRLNNLTKYVFVLYSFHTQNNQHKPICFQMFSLQALKIYIKTISMLICPTTTMLNPDIQAQ